MTGKTQAGADTAVGFEPGTTTYADCSLCAMTMVRESDSKSVHNGGTVRDYRASLLYWRSASSPRACGQLYVYTSNGPGANFRFCRGSVRNDESGLSLARIVIRDGGRGFDQAFHRLAGELSDEVEVLVKVQYGQSGEFSSRGDDQIRY